MFQQMIQIYCNRRKFFFRCKFRIKKQIFRLNNRFEFVHEFDHNHYIHSKIQTKFCVDESSQNIECLDQYCHETHEFYMRFCEKRVKQLKKLAIEIIHSSTIDEFKKLVDLNRLIYNVRRSNNFKHFLKTNLNRRSKSNINFSIMSKIIERLNKIFKIYRIILTMNDFVVKIKKLDRKIVVETISTMKISIFELIDRIVVQLRERAKLSFQRNDKNKIDRMFKR